MAKPSKLSFKAMSSFRLVNTLERVTDTFTYGVERPSPLMSFMRLKRWKTQLMNFHLDLLRNQTGWYT